MRVVATILGLSITASLAAAQAPATPPAPAPAPDVFVAPLSVRKGMLAVGRAVNATARPGYDNQPAFLRDNSGILFTSVRDDAQADIYRYDLASRAVTRVTATPESEYSATPLADGTSFSVVRVEPDSTQRLWRFPLGGETAPRLILERVKPVGYHAWIDDSTLALFVLGSPATLQVASVRSGGSSVFASDIGRGLQRTPGGRGVTYGKRSGDTLFIEELRFLSGGTGGGTIAQRRLARALKGQDYFVYTPAGDLLAASGTTLYRWSRDCRTNDGWERVGDLGPGIRNVSRLAVSPDGKWLAFVAAPR